MKTKLIIWMFFLSLCPLLFAQESPKNIMRACRAWEPPDITDCAIAPKVLYDPDPKYSKEARKKKIKDASVILGLVVGVDGLTHDIQVEHAAGYGLDENAIETVKTWKFAPGTYRGRLVPVAVNVVVNFKLY
ncbi:MAG TPA: energy transducer TonB [Terriglobales bacterium]|jgi:protein TonB